MIFFNVFIFIGLLNNAQPDPSSVAHLL